MVIKRKSIPYAYECTVGQNYIAFYTGERVILTDKRLNILSETDGLYYVYSGAFSEDETLLLMVSTGWDFYVLNTTDFSMRKWHIRCNHIGNIESIGCFGSNNDVYIPVFNTKTRICELRRYSLADNSYDVLYSSNERRIVDIEKENNKYLIVTDVTSVDDYVYSLIWYDGKSFTEYFVFGFLETLMDAWLDTENRQIFFDGFMGWAAYDYTGKRIVTAQNGKKERLLKLKMLIEDIRLNAENGAELHKLIDAAESRKNADSEYVRTFCCSSDCRYLYIGTTLRLIVINRCNGHMTSKNIEGGVTDIKETAQNFIMVSTWCDADFFEIRD